MERPPQLRFIHDKFKSAETSREMDNIKRSFDKIYLILRKNLHKPYRKVKTHTANPGPKYPAAYLWDSAFISSIWRCWDRNMALEIIRVFPEFQLDSGQLPKTVALGFIVDEKLTNPPLIAWAITETIIMDGKFEHFQEFYPSLVKFHEFLYRQRMKEGLFVWKHSYESGIDNSPRFTDASEKEKYDVDHLWAIDFNCWMVLQNQRLAFMASKLGKLDEEKQFKSLAESLKDKINNRLWDEATGYYYDYNFKTKQFIDIPTIFSLFPLYVGVPSEIQAQIMLRRIKNPEIFNTLVPFPTVARNHAAFSKDCWRGANWINTSYVVIKALENIGEVKFAAETAYRLIKGVSEVHQLKNNIFEFYDPDRYDQKELTRKKGNLYKQITLGGKPVSNFVGWTGLVNTLLIENIIGYRKIKGKTIILPHIPQSWIDTEIQIDIPQFSEQVIMKMAKNNDISGELIKYGNEMGQKTFTYNRFKGPNHKILWG